MSILNRNLVNMIMLYLILNKMLMKINKI